MAEQTTNQVELSQAFWMEAQPLLTFIAANYPEPDSLGNALRWIDSYVRRSFRYFLEVLQRHELLIANQKQVGTADVDTFYNIAQDCDWELYRYKPGQKTEVIHLHDFAVVKIIGTSMNRWHNQQAHGTLISCCPTTQKDIEELIEKQWLLPNSDKPLDQSFYYDLYHLAEDVYLALRQKEQTPA